MQYWLHALGRLTANESPVPFVEPLSFLGKFHHLHSGTWLMWELMIWHFKVILFSPTHMLSFSLLFWNCLPFSVSFFNKCGSEKFWTRIFVSTYFYLIFDKFLFQLPFLYCSLFTSHQWLSEPWRKLNTSSQAVFLILFFSNTCIQFTDP